MHLGAMQVHTVTIWVCICAACILARALKILHQLVSAGFLFAAPLLPPPPLPSWDLPVIVTENFKTSRLVLQAWLQSAPELVVVGIILYRNMSPEGPAVLVPGPILLQVTWRGGGECACVVCVCVC